MDAAAVETFAADLRGELIEVGDPEYDEARKLYNGMIDKHPALIARAVDAGDVMTAVESRARRGTRHRDPMRWSQRARSGKRRRRLGD